MTDELSRLTAKLS